MRDAVAELATEGRTLILCSHNLAEVERLCTRVAVIKNRLRRVASLTELRREGLALELKVKGDALEWVPALGRLAFKPEAMAEGQKLTVLLQNEEQAPEVVSQLAAAGARIYSVTRAARPLEEAYLELVREEDVP